MTCPICIMNTCDLVCPHCAYATCKPCSERYILGLVEEAQCMQCHAAFSLMFLKSELGYTFYTHEYQNHRRDVLYEQAYATLHLYQEKAQAILEERNLSFELKKIGEELNNKKSRQLRDWKSYDKLYRDMSDRRQLLHRFIKSPDRTMDSTIVSSEAHRYSYRCPCDECHGFVEGGICGICRTIICEKCRCIQEESHECKPSEVASVKLILQSTCACPTCKTPVHRISGCSQMWCTVCHTAFNYNTGEIERGVVHNPHLMEWIHRNRTPHTNDLCGISFLSVVEHMRRCSVEIVLHNNLLMFLYRLTVDDNLTQAMNHIKISNISSKAARFLLGEFKEESLRTALWTHRKQEIRRERNQEVIDTVRQVGTDIIGTFIGEKPTKFLYRNTVCTITDFFDQINNAFEDVSLEMGFKKCIRICKYNVEIKTVGVE